MPYLAGKAGKAARFTFPEIVGIAITRDVIESFDVGIGTISNGIDALFQTLSRSKPSHLPATIAVINEHSARLCVSEDLAEMDFARPTLVVACAPIVKRIRDHVLPEAGQNVQPGLPFPPRVMRP